MERAAIAAFQQQFETTRKDGGCYFSVDDVALCLELAARWRNELLPCLQKSERERLEAQLSVMRVALCYAWATKTRSAAATWARGQVSLWAGTALPELPEAIGDLVLVARDEKSARTGAEALIARIVMRVLGRHIEREER